MMQKERKSNIKPLVYLAFGLAIIILIGLISLNQPEYVYAMSIDETHQSIVEAEPMVDASEAAVFNPDVSTKQQYIDLRNEYEFSIGHVRGAINIPRHSLLKEDNFDILTELAEDGIVVILYGNDGSQANGPWMILNQLGFDNVKMLDGGYDRVLTVKNGEKQDDPFMPGVTEVARYDYNAVVDSILSNYSGDITSRPEPKPKPEAVIPVKRQKQSAIEGGC